MTPFGATVVLRPSLAVLAGTAPPIGAESSHGPLEFYDPLRVSCVTVGEQQIAMATDTSAALEYMLQGHNLQHVGRSDAARFGGSGPRETVPVGTAPSRASTRWCSCTGSSRRPSSGPTSPNEIMARPDLRNCFQLVAYRYPTGRPFVESAAVLRRELNAFVKTYDSQAQDPSMYNMAMVAHSMGGLVAKLTVTRSDDRLWYAVANRPLSEINVSDADRKRLAEWFYFEPVAVCAARRVHGHSSRRSDDGQPVLGTHQFTLRAISHRRTDRT